VTFTMTVKLEDFDHIIYHKSMLIQYPSYRIQHRLKVFCRRLVSSLALSHHQALSKNKGTENYTTVVFNAYLLFKLNLKKCNSKVPL